MLPTARGRREQSNAAKITEHGLRTAEIGSRRSQVPKLKAALTERGLDTKGLKKVLMERLLEAIEG